MQYILTNNTDRDIRIQNPGRTRLFPTQHGVLLADSAAAGLVAATIPWFIPAKHHTLISLFIPYEGYDAQRQEDFETIKEAVDKVSGLDGFSLFDDVDQIEINFPGDWTQNSSN